MIFAKQCMDSTAFGALPHAMNSLWPTVIWTICKQPIVDFRAQPVTEFQVFREGCTVFSLAAREGATPGDDLWYPTMRISPLPRLRTHAQACVCKARFQPLWTSLHKGCYAQIPVMNT